MSEHLEKALACFASQVKSFHTQLMAVLTKDRQKTAVASSFLQYRALFFVKAVHEAVVEVQCHYDCFS